MLEGGVYMKFSTFYFSGTGNTKWVVEQFNNIIANNGHKAEMLQLFLAELMQIPIYIIDTEGLKLNNNI